MELLDLLNSDDFSEYRKAEIELGTTVLANIWSDADPKYIKGALDMLSRIIRLPEGLARTPQLRELAEAMVTRDFADFTAQFLRRHLMAVDEDADEKGKEE